MGYNLIIECNLQWWNVKKKSLTWAPTRPPFQAVQICKPHLGVVCKLLFHCKTANSKIDFVPNIIIQKVLNSMMSWLNYLHVFFYGRNCIIRYFINEILLVSKDLNVLLFSDWAAWLLVVETHRCMPWQWVRDSSEVAGSLCLVVVGP